MRDVQKARKKNRNGSNNMGSDQIWNRALPSQIELDLHWRIGGNVMNNSQALYEILRIIYLATVTMGIGYAIIYGITTLNELKQIKKPEEKI